MDFHKAEFLLSSARVEQYPQLGLPEVVFVGRSNAGKSSLINVLLNRNNLAYVGKTPGKTRLLNFFLVDEKMVFTDAPGYGYAKGDKQSAISFGRLMEPYFKTRVHLKAVVLVLDVRRNPNEDDMLMVEYARANHLALLVAMTKVDKLSRSAMLQQRSKIANALAINTNCILPINNLKKEGVGELFATIVSYLEK